MVQPVAADRIITIPAKMRSTKPRLPDDLEIRMAASSEYSQIAAKLNEFYAGYNLYEPQTERSLEEAYTANPFRHYLAAVNKYGDVLAGLEVTEKYQFWVGVIQRMPAIFKLINAVQEVVPKDGTIRILSAGKLWYASGQKVARLTGDSTMDINDRATVLVTSIDGELDSPC
jgi:hypothetical protein